MRNAFRGGVVYFAVVFAAGFVLGTVRVVVFAPAIGEPTATVVELPIMLGISWVASHRVVNRCRVGASSRDRLRMGVSAFVFLMIAEAVLSLVLFARSPVEHLRHYAEPMAALGLAGQTLFALFPVMQRPR